MVTLDGTDPTTGNAFNYYVESGVPYAYAARGATTVAQYQTMAAQDTSQQQIAAQQAIADQQNAFNQQQFQLQQQQAQQEQDQANQQASLQSEYTQGRANLLDQGAQQVTNAFSQFTPDYFNQYATDYMSKAQDDITQQQQLAQKNLAFTTASQGLSDSQANVNEQGLIQQDTGRAVAQQTAAAQQAEAQLQSNVAGAKQNLMGQVEQSESIGSPIAGSSEQDVQSSLNTQRSAISGITSNAGDIVSSLGAVPTVNPISDIFSGVLGTAGSALSGLSAANTLNAFKTAAAGGGAPGPTAPNPGG
jgi:hypothetical protein